MMAARRQQMEGERNALLERLRTSRVELDGLVADMNSTQGNAKTEAVAAVVAELVSQHNDLLDLVQSQPGMMQQMQMMDMMQQMMQQMQMGMGQEEPEQ